MYFLESAVLALASARIVLAAAEPQITEAAVLIPRQNSDPSLVGWVSTAGASSFSVQRSCDFPATLSRSGSYAQCCATTGACNFFTSCNGGTLLAVSTSVPCDQGYCNTGVIIPSVGANGGQSFLGCWPTDYGTAAFSLVQNIGTAPVATPTGSGNSDSSDSASQTSGSDDSSSSPTNAATTDLQSTNTGSATTSASTTRSSTGAAAQTTAASLTGLFGAIGALIALL